MSVEEQQRVEIARLKNQVDELQQLLRSTTVEADRLRSCVAPSAESELLKAELDHERQKAKAIWAAVRHVAGEDGAHRIEEEVSRRPIVAAPKVRRRGTMPHMPTPHMTVVAKTATAPKWPPTTPREEEPRAFEEPVQVVAVQVQAEQSEVPKSEFDVDSNSVPPSVARRLFDLGFKGKEHKEAVSAESLPLSLPTKLDGASEQHNRARVAEVASPMRRRASSECVSLSGVPPLPRPHVLQTQPEAATLPGAEARQKVNVRSTTPTGALLNRRVPVETPPPPQVRLHSSSEDNTTPRSSQMQPMASSVRDRIRQLELSARRNSIQN
jgi:hypothetical protein